MKRYKVLLVMLPLILFGTLLKAQFKTPKYKVVQELKDKQLIVMVNPPNSDMVNRLNRKGKTETANTYQQVLEVYNDNMKAAAIKFWTMNSKEILFKTRDEIHDMMKDKSQRDKYVIMYCYSYEPMYKHNLDWNIDNSGDEIHGTHTFFAIGYFDDEPLFQQEFADLIPSATYLFNIVSMLNYDFNYVLKHNEDKLDIDAVVNENKHLISDKTLLIRESTISPKVIKDISTYYPCNYKVVSDSEMEHAVCSGDPAYVYVIKSGVNIPGSILASNTMCWIVNCEDGATLAYTRTGSRMDPLTNRPAELGKDFFQEIAANCSAGKKK